VCYMLAADLAQRLHRHSDTSPIRQVLLRWNRPLVSLRSVERNVQLLFKSAFQLPPKAAWTLFASWDHFAIACLKRPDGVRDLGLPRRAGDRALGAPTPADRPALRPALRRHRATPDRPATTWPSSR
jgi:hypothetical protein